MSIAADFWLFPAKNITKTTVFWHVLNKDSVYIAEICKKNQQFEFDTISKYGTVFYKSRGGGGFLH